MTYFKPGDRVRLKKLPLAEGTVLDVEGPLDIRVNWDRFKRSVHSIYDIELVPESVSESPIDVKTAKLILKQLYGRVDVPMQWIDDYLDTLNTARDVLRKNGIEELT